MRHGESEGNKKNVLTGKGNPPLTELGRLQAEIAGSLLRDSSFHRLYTSPTKRTLETAKIVAESGGFSDVPPMASPALGPHDYGELQGLSREKARTIYGPDLLLAYRRGFDTAPPGGESLGSVMKRIQLFYSLRVKRDLLSGKDVLMVLHGTGVVAMMAMLGNLSQGEVEKLDPPHGVPHIYEFEVAYRPADGVLEPVEPKLAVLAATPSLTPQLVLTARYKLDSPLFAQASMLFKESSVLLPEFAGVEVN